MNKFKNKNGYTLSEILMVVAIVSVLLALAVPAVFTIQKNLRQREMDSKAEIIYTAVQNKITELYTSGKSDVYMSDALKELGAIPKDADGDINEDGIYYFTSSSSLVSELVGEDVLDANITGTFVVEVIPYAYREVGETRQLTAPSVYAVFYSESDDYNLENIYEPNRLDDNTFLSKYRAKKANRISLTNGYLGYYGGGLADGGSSSNLFITSEITSNKVVNNAIVKLKKPLSVDGKVTVTFTFSDDYGHSCTIEYDTNSGWFTYNGTKINSKLISVSTIGINTTFTFTLDDLSSDSKRFKNTFGSNTNYGLVEGSNITLSVNAKSDDMTVEPASSKCYGNSIYGYDKGNDDKTLALISNPRHLQNLDNSSSVTSNITNVRVTDDIDFNVDENFYDQYKKAYFNGLITITRVASDASTYTEVVPNFKGINNDNLTTFDGNDKKILSLSSSSSGLFNSANNLTISNLSLIGETVSSSEVAGGLIGTAKGNVTIDNVKSILTTDNGDYPSGILNENNIEALRWIVANTSGGLVGVNNGNLTISNSNASSVLGNDDSISGGLVGLNNGSINVNRSYSDCYLYGNNVGGLVGSTNNSNITISNSYVAGFAVLKDKNSIGAGLVNGGANSITNSYTVLASSSLDSNDSGNRKGCDPNNSVGLFISTVTSVNEQSNLYYLIKSNGMYSNYGSAIGNNTTLNLGSEFVNDNSVKVVPYKLMGQSISNYKYPKISGLDHYGDWNTDFNSGSLVYYEVYSDNTAGFDGAGVNVSLRSDLGVLGDGYGIVFKADMAINDFSYTVNGNTYNVSASSTDTLSVTVGNNRYIIYKLDKSVVNPTSVNSYYTAISVVSNAETKYFNFNPHFARSVVELNNSGESSSNPSEVSIRTARQLYNLSLYYSNYSPLLNTTYKQERNIKYSTYNFSGYSNFANINEQSPIGKNVNDSFKDTYDGGSYEISDISFVSEKEYYVGLFGYNAGTIKNTVLATQYDTNSSTYYYAKSKASITTNMTLYSGILVGYNKGNVTNSAVAGYYLSGNATIYGYANSTVYVGGFVGFNEGKINNCSADNPKLSINMYRANCYTGGFVGHNLGTINDCYALNNIDSTVRNGNTVIAGFVGENKGNINNSYCADVLTSSGEGSHSYSFGNLSDSGTVKNSYYLFRGSFRFVDKMYVFGGTGTNTSGAYKTYGQLVALVNGQNAKSSKYHDLTTRFSSDETNYPYRAVVKDSSNNYVHYGEWTVIPSLGTFGMFYWEKEEDGQNNGYKITYIGGSNGTLQYDSTLCTVHDDGGNIASYGYGYYVIEGEESSVELDTNSIDGLTFGSTYDSEVASALKEQIQGFTFYPYVSGHDVSNNISLKTGYSGTYGIVNLVYTNSKDSSKTQTLTYRIAPFFANSFSLISSDFNETNAHLNSEPGVDIPFEIRSATQLQYINWNNSDYSTKSLVTASNYTKYNYLAYATVLTAKTKDDTNYKPQTSSNAENKVALNLEFKQSHDLNAENIANFTPIAGQGKGSSSGKDTYSATLYAWFASKYDGQNYKIQELNISSNSYSVGLFGVTVGAEIKNTILYSTKNATISRDSVVYDGSGNITSYGDDGAYSLGGLIGVAYDYNTNPIGNVITNCAIAGYNIVDNSKNVLTLGEANVGGLIGVSNVNVDKCSSVVNIKINCTHTDINGNVSSATKALYGDFIRVGGISGAVQNSITNSYSGGTITVSNTTLDETYNSSYKEISVSSYSLANVNKSTNIYLAGIAGSGFTMNYCNFTGTGGSEVTDGKPYIKNCYTYMTFPKMEGTIRSITMFASIADRYSQGTYATIENCYYLNSSARIDTSNLPKYYFGVERRSNYKSEYEAMTDNMKEKMILGYTNWVQTIFNNSNTDDGNIIKITTSSANKDYDALSSDEMINLLDNSAFNRITTTDSQGQTVNGKYSFNAGNNELDGKDYPFPTVIKEDSNNVHYGVWPNNNAYFEYGTYTLDIFKNMESVNKDSYAYMDLKLVKLADETFDEGKLNVQILNEKGEENTNIAEIVNYDENNKYGIDADDNYLIKVQANNTGTVTVKATWTENGESKFAISTLTVTANLNVMASPNSIDLKNNESSIYKIGKNSDSNYLMAYASNNEEIDYSSLCEWSYISSKINDEDAVTLNGEKTRLTIRSNGYSATVTATAKYNYHNVIFSSITSINVGSYGGIGISDSTNYNEALVKNDDIDEVSGNDKSYSKELAPTNENSTYFIYDRNIGLFNNVDSKNVTISITKDGEAIEGLASTLDSAYSSTAINDENIFYSIPLNIYYRVSSFDEDTITTLDNVLISATVHYNNVSYKVNLTTSITATPYNLILDAGDGKFVDSTSSKSIEIRETISLSDYAPTREGYEFAGWYYKNGDKFKGDKVTVEGAYDIQKDNEQQDIKLYAHWNALEGSINLDLNYDNLDIITLTNVKYGSDSIELSTLSNKLTRTGFILQGFYYIDGEDETLVLDKNGKVVNIEMFNSLILNQKDGFIPTLTAKWIEGYALNINAGDKEYSFNCDKNSDVEFVVNDNGLIIKTTIDGSIITSTVPYSMKFFGLYEGDNKVIDEHGGSITMSDNKTLNLSQGSRVTFKTKDGTTQFATVDYINGQGAYVPTLNDNYSIEGWYDENGNKVLNSDGVVLDGNKLANEITVYARFKTTGYVVSSTMDSNSTYVITSGTKIMTGSGSSVGSSTLSTTTDTSGNAYIPSSFIGTGALWTYDGSKIKNYSTNSYLAAYSSSLLWHTYYYLELQNSKNIDNWSYSDGSLVRNNNYYVYLNENSFTCSADYSSNIVLYEFSKDIITENYK